MRGAFDRQGSTGIAIGGRDGVGAKPKPLEQTEVWRLQLLRGDPDVLLTPFESDDLGRDGHGDIENGWQRRFNSVECGV